MRTDRLETFADGVLTIAPTLLILNVDTQVGENAGDLAYLWGKETQSAAPTWPFASRPTRHQTAQMLWSIRYRLLCWLLRTLVRCGLDELDLETVVLLWGSNTRFHSD